MNTSKLYDLTTLKTFRHILHKSAELSFQEYKTQELIHSFLRTLNIPETSIQKCAKTGLVVTIFGKASAKGHPFLLALRADIDGLEMTENNPDLAYRSTSNAAHTCGHDGHTVGLLGFVALFMERISEIPLNKGIRLLFQPSEEDTPGDLSGADAMVQEECLEGVDEVYGLHNCPHPFGTLFIKSGYIAAEFLNVKVKILGTGGHAGDPDLSGDPVQPGVDIYVMLRALIKKKKDKGNYFCFSLPYFHAGTANNVIAEFAEMKGTFRSIDSKFTKEFVEEFEKNAKEICEKHGCKCEVDIKLTCPAIINTEKETLFIKKLGEEFFGKEKVGEELFPILGSDDFAFFLQQKPGAYFGIGIGRPERQLHSPNYDFNDDAIDIISKFWMKITENKLLI